MENRLLWASMKRRKGKGAEEQQPESMVVLCNTKLPQFLVLNRLHHQALKNPKPASKRVPRA